MDSVELRDWNHFIDKSSFDSISLYATLYFTFSFRSHHFQYFSTFFLFNFSFKWIEKYKCGQITQMLDSIFFSLAIAGPLFTFAIVRADELQFDLARIRSAQLSSTLMNCSRSLFLFCRPKWMEDLRFLSIKTPNSFKLTAGIATGNNLSFCFFLWWLKC